MEGLEDFKINLGLKIKALRERRKLTQEQLGDLIEKDYQAISRLERGLVNPSAYLVFQIANALEVKIEELFLFD
ncbi:helix-turn-helix transcriptional regulator [Algoriphagus sp.]|uniref:helix-turn-helix transcriptional regulator n=1 Tax=Algoriphagus sp. TaxID=1872435 RepID=UPI0026330C14|nr:helix-turn-helix transcriptional regulator [Algoriphagus sp.]